MKIPPFSPDDEISMLRDQFDAAISRVLDHGQFILGPEVSEFEQNVSEFLGVEYAIGVNSGTDALLIALRAMGIGEGDEVITTPMSFFATAESISQLGAKPVFVDIDPNTFNIDIDKIEEKISDRTKALLPVHLFGRPVEMPSILDLAKKHNLLVLEDCAQSFGATSFGLDGQKIVTGSIGDTGAYSFFPTKNLGGFGDGGLITTNNKEIAETARMLRVHGSRKKYHNEVLGYNSRLDAIQAAILNVKLNYVDEFNAKRRNVAEFYNRELREIDSIKCPEIIQGHVFHQYTIQVKNGKRDELKQYLSDHEISSKIYFPIPMNELDVYANENFPPTPLAKDMAQSVLSLPIWPLIDEEKLQTVANCVKKFFRK